MKGKELKFKVNTSNLSITKRLGSGGSGTIVYSCNVDGKKSFEFTIVFISFLCSRLDLCNETIKQQKQKRKRSIRTRNEHLKFSSKSSKYCKM